MGMYDPIEDEEDAPPQTVPDNDPRAGLYAYLREQAANRAKGQQVPSYQALQDQSRGNADASARNAFAAQLQNSASMMGTLNGKRSDASGPAELAKSLDAAGNEDLSGGYAALAQRNRDVATEGNIYRDLQNPDVAREKLYAGLQARMDADRLKSEAERGRNERFNKGIESINKPSAAKKPFVQFLPDVKGPNGEPMMIDPETGQAKVVDLPPGFTKTPKAGSERDTKAQFEVGGYAKRLEQAEQVFDELEKEGYKRGDTFDAAKNKILPGAFQDDGYKRNEQAERNFVNSVLRRESGAAISSSEFESAEKQYFPRPGDSPALLAQKRANRQQVMSSFRAEARGAYDKIPGVDVPPPEGATGEGDRRGFGPSASPDKYEQDLQDEAWGKKHGLSFEQAKAIRDKRRAQLGGQ